MAGKHRAADATGDIVTSRGEHRRAPKPGERVRRKPSYQRGRDPIQILPAMPDRTREMPAVSVSRSVGRAPARPSSASSPTRRARRDQAAGLLAGEATEYARRSAIRASSGGRPTVSGRAAAGAAGGASAGAALGSVVPGVGTALGAGAGAVVGGAGGAVSGARAKREYRAAMRGNAGARRLLMVEFIVCATVVALSPLTDTRRTEPPAAWMKRMTAVMGLFFVLGLVSAGGRGPAKAAAGFGGLITVVLLVSGRDVFAKVATIMGQPNRPQPASGSGQVDHSGEMRGA